MNNTERLYIPHTKLRYDCCGNTSSTNR